MGPGASRRRPGEVSVEVNSRGSTCYCFEVPITDTSPHFEALQIDLYRKAGSARRATIAAELSDAVRETALAGIKRRHPEYSETEARDSFLDLLYGQE